MPTAYPGALDAWTNPGEASKMDDPEFYHDVAHANVYDAIEAIEALLGINGQNFTRPGTALTTVLRAGHYHFTTPGAPGAVSTLGNGTLRVSPWFVPRDVTLTRIGAEVTSAGDAASVLRLGIYADDGAGAPSGAPLYDGTIPGNAVAVVENTISLALTRGIYWVAAVVQGVVTTQPGMRVVANVAWPYPLVMGTAAPGAGATTGGLFYTGVTGALPTISTVGSATGVCPRLFVKT